ncbi:MAG: LysR family transcriptional regulator [Rhodospirillaceae bacterium]|mgnify:CR=1 FL=1|jgi:DNA-binding transcriptional LysR family regulator|nr:LysR family transcriptional regulator [Rhodospirillaceae bacterium]
MEIRQLEHFLAVIEQGSLGRAAEALNISEPGLSKSIRRLEDSLQIRLLDRGTRGMTPTLFGESLATHARLIRNEVDHARSELSELQGVSKGIVRIGARPSFGTVILPRAIAQLQNKRPGVRAIVREGMMSNMIVEVLHGDLDFIVVTLSDQTPDDDLIQESLIDSPVSIVARAGHPFGNQNPLSPDALAEMPWILPLGSDPVRQKLEEMLAKCGIEKINVLVESDSVQFIMEYLRETDAIGFFPEPMIMRSRIKEDFAILDVKELKWQRQLGIIRRKRTSLTPAALLLVQELKILCEHSS